MESCSITWQARRCRYAGIALLICTVAVGSIQCGNGARETDAPLDVVDPEKQRVQDFWTLNREANKLRLAGDFEAAAEVFERCLELDPSHEDTLYYLGASLEGSGERDRAAAAYRKIIALNATSNRAISQLARLLARPEPFVEPEFDEARALLQRSMELNREHSGPYLDLGRLELDAGNYPAALEAFDTAARYGSELGVLFVGYTRELLGDSAGAREAFDRVVAADKRRRSMAASGLKQEGDLESGPGTQASPFATPADVAGAYLAVLEAAKQSPPVAGEWSDITARVGLYPNAGRAAWADLDADGDSDVALVGAGPVRLFRNEDAQFSEISAAAGLSGASDIWDAAWGDFDADRNQDLYLIGSGYHGRSVNRLFRGGGSIRFEEVRDITLNQPRSTVRAFFADLDGDGRPEIVEVGGAYDSFSGLRVLHNAGTQWRDVSTEWGLAVENNLVDVACADYDGDGRLDLYAVPWRRHGILFRNESNGHFVDVTVNAGLARVRGLGLSTVFLDYDGDGLLDLLSTHHAFRENLGRPSDAGARLFHNTGRDVFEEVSLQGNFAILNSPRATIQTLPIDVDHDGWTDLVLAGGRLGKGGADTTVVLRNLQGKGFEMEAQLPPQSVVGNTKGISGTDINGDGRVELYLPDIGLFGQRPHLR